jgi:hypothetical protein
LYSEKQVVNPVIRHSQALNDSRSDPRYVTFPHMRFSRLVVDAIRDRCREAESISRECDEREAELKEIEVRLVATSMRLIAESRELLLKVDKLFQRDLGAKGQPAFSPQLTTGLNG